VVCVDDGSNVNVHFHVHTPSSILSPSGDG
jgi:hypothetical protein